MATDADGKNLHSLICQHCKSIVLRNGDGNFVDNKPIELPNVTVNKADPADNYKSFDVWWFVQDVMTFENVGVTNAKDGKRYLCCADCEMGPLGIQVDNGYYLAQDRIVNKTE